MKTGLPLHVTFTNEGYALLMRNWAEHHQKLGLLYLVIALDEATTQLCAKHGINSMPWSVSLASRYRRRNLHHRVLTLCFASVHGCCD